jgi:hypothetical protein
MFQEGVVFNIDGKLKVPMQSDGVWSLCTYPESCESLDNFEDCKEDFVCEPFSSTPNVTPSVVTTIVPLSNEPSGDPSVQPSGNPSVQPSDSVPSGETNVEPLEKNPVESAFTPSKDFLLLGAGVIAVAGISYVAYKYLRSASSASSSRNSSSLSSQNRQIEAVTPQLAKKIAKKEKETAFNRARNFYYNQSSNLKQKFYNN